MNLSKLYIFPLVTVVVVASALFSKVPVAQSSDLYQSGSTSNSSEVSDEILDRYVLEEGQVLLVQTESEGTEPIREAKVVTITRNHAVIVEDSNGEVIRAFQGLGVDLMSYAVMSEAEALQLLEAGGNIVEDAKE
jgi:hypothetical protein